MKLNLSRTHHLNPDRRALQCNRRKNQVFHVKFDLERLLLFKKKLPPNIKHHLETMVYIVGHLHILGPI
jgi:hypothetical protein